MKTAFLVLAFAAVAAASENFFWDPKYDDEFGQLDRGCCLPTQWEGRVGSFYMRARLLVPKFRISDSKVGLDFKNKKVGARSLFFCRKTKKVYQARSVADFKAKKAYFIYKNKCKTVRIKSDLKRPCIPSKFRRFAPYTYGAGSSSLQLAPYGLRDNRLEYFIAVTQGSCLPIKGAYRTRKGKRTITTGNYQYYNITTGNKDRQLYNVPSFCNSEAEQETESSNWWQQISDYMPSTNKEEEPFSSSSELSAASDEAMSHIVSLLNGNGAMLDTDSSWLQQKWRSMKNKFE